NNFGLVEVQTGTLIFSTPFTNFGSMTLAAGTATWLGAGSASGSFTTTATALVDFRDSYSLNPGAELDGDGLYRINGSTVTFNTNLTVQYLDLAGGILQGGATVTINSNMNWRSGTMSGSAR